MEIQYRKLRTEDSIAYRAIRLECLKEFPENFGSEYEVESAKEKLAFQIYIEDQNPNHFVVGAFSDEKLIGISAFSRFDTSKFQHRGILFQVYVNPKFQGLKIGENLVRQTLTSAFA